MASQNGRPILSVRNVHKHFGGLKAVNGVSFDIEPGKIIGLIGPNGAGKTTTFNTIAGLYKPDAGEILFKGENIAGFPPHTIFHKGLARTFQVSRELKLMTVLENLMLVPPQQRGENLFVTWLTPWRVRGQEQQLREKALETLEFVELDHLKDEYAENLSGGQKRLLELARTMMADPDLILLDEPGAGVNPTLKKKLVGYIQQLAQEHSVTIFLIEHDMDLVMNICERVVVMSSGEKLAEGTPEEVREDKEVLEAYLGGQYR